MKNYQSGRGEFCKYTVLKILLCSNFYHFMLKVQLGVIVFQVCSIFILNPRSCSIVHNKRYSYLCFLLCITAIGNCLQLLHLSGVLSLFSFMSVRFCASGIFSKWRFYPVGFCPGFVLILQ